MPTSEKQFWDYYEQFSRLSSHSEYLIKDLTAFEYGNFTNDQLRDFVNTLQDVFQLDLNFPVLDFLIDRAHALGNMNGINIFYELFEKTGKTVDKLVTEYLNTFFRPKTTSNVHSINNFDRETGYETIIKHARENTNDAWVENAKLITGIYSKIVTGDGAEIKDEAEKSRYKCISNIVKLQEEYGILKGVISFFNCTYSNSATKERLQNEAGLIGATPPKDAGDDHLNKIQKSLKLIKGLLREITKELMQQNCLPARELVQFPKMTNNTDNFFNAIARATHRECVNDDDDAPYEIDETKWQAARDGYTVAGYTAKELEEYHYDETTNTKTTLLHMAVEKQFPEVVTWLLAQRVNPLLPDDKAENAMQKIFQYGENPQLPDKTRASKTAEKILGIFKQYLTDRFNTFNNQYSIGTTRNLQALSEKQHYAFTLSMFYCYYQHADKIFKINDEDIGNITDYLVHSITHRPPFDPIYIHKKGIKNLKFIREKLGTRGEDVFTRVTGALVDYPEILAHVNLQFNPQTNEFSYLRDIVSIPGARYQFSYAKHLLEKKKKEANDSAYYWLCSSARLLYIPAIIMVVQRITNNQTLNGCMKKDELINILKKFNYSLSREQLPQQAYQHHCSEEEIEQLKANVAVYLDTLQAESPIKKIIKNISEFLNNDLLNINKLLIEIQGSSKNNNPVIPNLIELNSNLMQIRREIKLLIFNPQKNLLDLEYEQDQCVSLLSNMHDKALKEVIDQCKNLRENLLRISEASRTNQNKLADNDAFRENQEAHDFAKEILAIIKEDINKLNDLLTELQQCGLDEKEERDSREMADINIKVDATSGEINVLIEDIVRNIKIPREIIDSAGAPKPNDEKGSMKNQVGEQADTEWYKDDEINTLLKHYLEGKPAIEQLVAMAVIDGNGTHILKEQLLDFKKVRNGAQPPLAEKIFVPVLINQNHWTLLYFIYPENGATSPPQIYYFDPLGNPLPENLKKDLKELNLFPESEVTSIPYLVQNDSHNCGPWIVEAVRAIAKKEGMLPEREYDIAQARTEHQKILNPQFHEKELTVRLMDNKEFCSQKNDSIRINKIIEECTEKAVRIKVTLENCTAQLSGKGENCDYEALENKIGEKYKHCNDITAILRIARSALTTEGKLSSQKIQDEIDKLCCKINDLIKSIETKIPKEIIETKLPDNKEDLIAYLMSNDELFSKEAETVNNYKTQLDEIRRSLNIFGSLVVDNKDFTKIKQEGERCEKINSILETAKSDWLGIPDDAKIKKLEEIIGNFNERLSGLENDTNAVPDDTHSSNCESYIEAVNVWDIKDLALKSQITAALDAAKLRATTSKKPKNENDRRLLFACHEELPKFYTALAKYQKFKGSQVSSAFKNYISSVNGWIIDSDTKTNIMNLLTSAERESTTLRITGIGPNNARTFLWSPYVTPKSNPSKSKYRVIIAVDDLAILDEETGGHYLETIQKAAKDRSGIRSLSNPEFRTYAGGNEYQKYSQLSEEEQKKIQKEENIYKIRFKNNHGVTTFFKKIEKSFAQQEETPALKK